MQINKKIITAYTDIIFYTIYFLLLSAAVTLLGILSVAPLWYAASKYKTFYTAACLSIIVILCILNAVRRIKKDKKYIFKISQLFTKIIMFVIISFLIYSSFVMLSYQLYLQTFLFIFITLIAAGLLKFLFIKKNAA